MHRSQYYGHLKKLLLAFIFLACLGLAGYFFYKQKYAVQSYFAFFPASAKVLVYSQNAAKDFAVLKKETAFGPLTNTSVFKRFDEEFFFLKVKLSHHTDLQSFFDGRVVSGAYLNEEGGNWIWLFQAKEGEEFEAIFESLAKELKALKDIRWTERKTEAGNIIDAVWLPSGKTLSVHLWEKGLVLSKSAAAVESYAFRKKEGKSLANNLTVDGTDPQLYYKTAEKIWVGGAVRQEKGLWIASREKGAIQELERPDSTLLNGNSLGWQWCSSRILHWRKSATERFPITQIANSGKEWAEAIVEISGGNGTEKIWFTTRSGALPGELQDIQEGGDKANWARLPGDTAYWALEYENTWVFSRRLSVLKQWLADVESGRTLTKSPLFGNIKELISNQLTAGEGVFPARWKTHNHGNFLADSFAQSPNWAALGAFYSNSGDGFLVLSTVPTPTSQPKTDSVLREETWQEPISSWPLLFRNEYLSGWDVLVSDRLKNAVWFPKNRRPLSLSDSLSSAFTHVFQSGKGEKKLLWFLGETQAIQIQASALAKIPPTYSLTELPGKSKGVFLPDAQGGCWIFYTQSQGWHIMKPDQAIHEWIPKVNSESIGVPIENLAGFELEGKKWLHWINDKNEAIWLDASGNLSPGFPIQLGRSWPNTFIENEGSLKDSRIIWVDKQGKQFSYNLSGDLIDTLQYLRKTPTEEFRLVADALQRTYVSLATDDKQGYRIIGPDRKTWAEFKLPGKTQEWVFAYYAMSADNQSFTCFNPKTKQAGIIFLKSSPIQARWFQATAPLKLLYSEHSRLWQIYLVNATKFRLISIPPPSPQIR